MQCGESCKTLINEYQAILSLAQKNARSEIHDLVRTTQRSNGNRDEGREPMKTTEDKLKLSGKKKKDKGCKIG